MDRLTLFIAMMSGTVLSGVLLVIAFTFEAYALWAILLAVAVGWGIALPVSFAISTRIKRRDPNWTRRDPTDPDTDLGPNAREL